MRIALAIRAVFNNALPRASGMQTSTGTELPELLFGASFHLYLLT
ncbi:MAG: hypothetical protein ACK2U3_10475 [Anaerolineales bacterium]